MDVTIIKVFRVGSPKAKIVLIPNNVMNNCLAKHVAWAGIKQNSTVFIREKPRIFTNNRGPSFGRIFKLILHTFKFQRAIYRGANAYLIDHNKFDDIKLATINKNHEIIEDNFKGAICARVKLFRRNKLINYLRNECKVSNYSEEKINNTINKLINFPGVKIVSFFVVTHMHPIKLGARCN